MAEHNDPNQLGQNLGGGNQQMGNPNSNPNMATGAMIPGNGMPDPSNQVLQHADTTPESTLAS
eukprot:CAMPEP_0115017754 /NCGR_PEP_ID=MMETSP0216-20121206/28330_1 /TAXON_ID=223996 /ORGANISM="Protocruzia adherens, Strain Boccale" /LENGTH=62 /DNA_ID=CAMNT_0002388681 /DNA_START=28 /DNA_END=213 /DNA_ORIENTATION=+